MSKGNGMCKIPDSPNNHYVIPSLVLSIVSIGLLVFIIDTVKIGTFPNGTIMMLPAYILNCSISSLPLLVIIGIAQLHMARFGIVLSMVVLFCITTICWIVYSRYVYPPMETNPESIIAMFHHFGMAVWLLLPILVPVIFFLLSRTSESRGV